MMESVQISKVIYRKSRIRETPTLLTDADSRTDTILEKLRNFFLDLNTIGVEGPGGAGNLEDKVYFWGL